MSRLINKLSSLEKKAAEKTFESEVNVMASDLEKLLDKADNLRISKEATPEELKELEFIHQSLVQAWELCSDYVGLFEE